MRTWLFRGLLAAGVAVSPGCAVVEEVGDALTSRTDAPAPSGPALAVEPAAPAAAPAAAAATAARAATDDAPRPKRKPDVIDPRTLVGLDKAAVSKIFGEPHRITMGQPALVWSWRTDGCEMRLFFYPDVSEQTFRALAYAFSAPDDKRKTIAVDTCASRIRWAHAENSR